MKNVKKTLATAVFALSSIAATAIIPATSLIDISVATTGLMTISLPAQAVQQCANFMFESQGIQAHGTLTQRIITIKAFLQLSER